MLFQAKFLTNFILALSIWLLSNILNPTLTSQVTCQSYDSLYHFLYSPTCTPKALTSWCSPCHFIYSSTCSPKSLTSWYSPCHFIYSPTCSPKSLTSYCSPCHPINLPHAPRSHQYPITITMNFGSKKTILLY